MWNRHRASVVNQMLKSVQKYEQYNIQASQYDSLADSIKEKNSRQNRKVFLEQVVSNSSGLITFFQATT